MKLTGSDIRKQDFPRKMRGYDMLDVNAFLQFVADAVDQLNARNDEMNEQCADFMRQIEKMREREDRLEKSLRAVNELREEVRTRADASIENARSEADRLIHQAEEDASRIRQESDWNSRRLKDEVTSLEILREKTLQNFAGLLRTQTRLLENEADRLGIDISEVTGTEAGKVVSINQKSEGEAQ